MHIVHSSILHIFGVFPLFDANMRSNITGLYRFLFLLNRKIVELEEELRVVGNNLKSLEVSEEKVRATRFS